MIGDTEYPRLQPFLESLAGTSFFVVLEIERVIPARVALSRRGVRTEWLMDNAGNYEAGDQCSIRIA